MFYLNSTLITCDMNKYIKISKFCKDEIAFNLIFQFQMQFIHLNDELIY